MGRNIGFLGTGIMGSGMVRNLIEKGHTVTVYNRTRAKAEAAALPGGRVAATPAEAVREAEVVITMLADPAAVLGVIEGEHGVLSAIRPGAVLIDSSTISPPASQRIREQVEARGARMLDAPVFGSRNEARRGELGLVVGGEPEVLAQVQDVLDSLGRTLHVGGPGLGVQAKLVVNLVIAASLHAFNEGMVLATKAGINPDTMLQIIQSSRGRSGIIDMKAPQILKRDFTPFFPLKLMAKDIGLVLDAARSLQVPAPLATALHDIYAASLAAGLADEDFTATVRLLEGAAGVEVKSAPLEV